MTRIPTMAGVLAAAIAGGWWIARDDVPVQAPPAEPPDAVATVRIESAPAVDVSAKTRTATVARTGADAALAGFTAGKYRFLTSDLFRRGSTGDRLQAALLERERIAVALNTARQSLDERQREATRAYEAQLGAADTRIRALLHPTDYAVFEALKDSDIEQFQLDDYAAGIDNVAPLSAENRRAILLTKLNYKRTFRQVLLDSGLLRHDLSPAARRAAFDGVNRAFAQYRDSYLAEVRQYLFDDEQYALLLNYESSEFDAELARLRSMAGG
jgi:hypothetical protein